MDTNRLKRAIERREYEVVRIEHSIETRQKEITRLQIELDSVNREVEQLKHSAEEIERHGLRELIRLCTTPCSQFVPREYLIPELG